MLPSSPGGVHEPAPRGTRPSAPFPGKLALAPCRGEEFHPAVAGCGFRAPPAPRVARPLQLWYAHAQTVSMRSILTRAPCAQTAIASPPPFVIASPLSLVITSSLFPLSLRAKRGNLVGEGCVVQARDRHAATLLAMTNWVRARPEVLGPNTPSGGRTLYAASASSHALTANRSLAHALTGIVPLPGCQSWPAECERIWKAA